jgi:hypothetical protein
MSDLDSNAHLNLLSQRTLSADGKTVFSPHSHGFYEFTLVTDDACTIQVPNGEQRPTKPNSLFFYHVNEEHGASCTARQNPRFWVVHFQASEEVIESLSHLAAPQSSDRIWQLSPENVETFQWIFLQLLNEHSSGRPHQDAAASSWLQLLLINVDRWVERSRKTSSSLPTRVSPEVLNLWHQVNESVSRPNDQLSSLYSAPNYDSTRHAFRKVFGCSPREMLQRLRMEHAKNLLLETSLSIKEISERVGYVRQHDFNRLFHRHAGVAPSHWRTDPTTR